MDRAGQPAGQTMEAEPAASQDKHAAACCAENAMPVETATQNLIRTLKLVPGGLAGSIIESEVCRCLSRCPPTARRQ